MPTTAPAIKVEGARAFGAEVILEGTTSADRRARAEDEAAATRPDHGAAVRSRVDHRRPGNGRARDPRTAAGRRGVVVPIGGGGLVAGVAAAIKQSKPVGSRHRRRAGGAAAMKASLDAGHPVTLPRHDSVADGLMPVRPGDLTFAHVQAYVDAVVTVDDDEIVDAVRWAFLDAKIVAEPSGAATIAAVRSGDALDRAHPWSTGPVVAIVSGGNIALEKLQLAMRNRTLRDGADAVDVGEPRRLRHERERRPPADAARARRDGIRSRRLSRSAARLQPVERHARAARADRGALSREHASDTSRSPTARPKPTTSSRSRSCARTIAVAMEAPNYMQMPGVARSLGADVRTFRLRQENGWEPDWEEFDGRVTPGTRCSTSRTRTTRPALSCRPSAMERIVDRCERTGTWILADEVYLGAEIDRPRTRKLLGHERSRHRDERAVEGIRHSRRSHRLDRGAAAARRGLLVAARLPDDRTQQAVGSRWRRWPSKPENRERCYARTRAILQQNLPIARDWIAGFGGRLTWREPQAGAIALAEVRRACLRASRSPSACASPEHAHRPRRPRRPRRAPAGLARRAGNRSCAKGCGGSATS